MRRWSPYRGGDAIPHRVGLHAHIGVGGPTLSPWTASLYRAPRHSVVFYGSGSEEAPASINKKKISSKNNLLKLDVQGSELDILKGLGNKIDTFEAIILETSVRRYNQSSPLFIKIINFMYKKNFIFYDLCDLK